jgi:hypothetical protein
MGMRGVAVGGWAVRVGLRPRSGLSLRSSLRIWSRQALAQMIELSFNMAQDKSLSAERFFVTKAQAILVHSSLLIENRSQNTEGGS